MTSDQPIITADEHERIYRAYWRGCYASKSEIRRVTGHALTTVTRLIETVPPRLAMMPDSLTPADRVRWAVQHRICLVCAEPTNRVKGAYLCFGCEACWRWCPDCEKPLPLAYFYSRTENYCAYHKGLRDHPDATPRQGHAPRVAVKKSDRDSQTAEIVRLRAAGASWEAIGEAVGLKANTATKRYIHWQQRQKASEA